MPKKQASEGNQMELKSVTIAVGTYEGGLLVYVVDLIKAFHVPYFSAADNLVIFRKI